MNDIIYVLTPAGERKPVKVNEDGELIVNVEATVASNVKIEDSAGNTITSGAYGELFNNIIDDNGDPLATDNGNAAAKSLNVKLVDGDGNLLGQAGGAPMYVRGDLSPTDPAATVLAIAIKDYLGANVTGDNNDPSNTSVNVKLLASDNTLLGQANTPIVVKGLVGGTPVNIADSYGFPLITQNALNDTEIDNALLVTGIYRRGVNKLTATFIDYPVTSINSYLGLLGFIDFDRAPISGHFVKQIQNVTIVNKKYLAALSGAIDIYFVVSGSAADSYFVNLAIPDDVDLDTNFADYDGIMQVVTGLAPENVGGIGLYSASVNINGTDGSRINIYLAAAAAASFSQSWKATISWEEIAAGIEF